ncbi:MAG: Ni/Fe hydrogenase subunit beta [Acidobacteria bacterium]|nr:MAG: Ni/Fe hydrogenase subunit beta [Acidobacteriota bacterium]
MEVKGEDEGSNYLIDLDSLVELFGILSQRYRVWAPKVKDGVIRYMPTSSFGELALGYRNIELPGYYELKKEEGYFTYTHPVNSLKELLHPPELPLMRVVKQSSELLFDYTMPNGERLCLFDVRACDLWALEVLDRVFIKNNPKPDPYYKSLRDNLFTVGVNCSYATSTCFCTTMGTGPEVRGGYDLLLTELKEGFLLQVGSEEGREVIGPLKKRRAEERHLQEKENIIKRTEGMMQKDFHRQEARERLYGRMDETYWEPVGKRCLACTNCTQVCPTCFCFDMVEKNGLSESYRVRAWDSCFSPSFATLHRFNLRQSIHSRYRQWLMHKFAYWVDQFGTYGCVGCGRCITWCPVGIDVRQEVRRIVQA